MEMSALHWTLCMKTTAKVAWLKCNKSSPFCPSETGFWVLRNLQIRVQAAARGTDIKKTAEVCSSPQDPWKPCRTPTFLSQKAHQYTKMIQVQRLWLLWEKSPSSSHLNYVNLVRENCNYPKSASQAFFSLTDKSCCSGHWLEKIPGPSVLEINE